MKTGDIVLHKPTGEQWLVAGVENGYVMWCGWPEGRAPMSDCELIESVDSDAELSLLRTLAAMSSPDMRRSFAQRRLAEIGAQ